MKKTLLASAIAVATFSGSALAMENASTLAAKLDSMPTVYGNIQYAITHTDVEDNGSGVEHFDNGSTLGVKHDHEIAPGITAFLKLELEGISADNKAGNKNGTAEFVNANEVKVGDDNGGLNELDEAYIGIKGDSFGQIWVGSDDSRYERLIDGIEEYYEVAALNIGADFETGEGDSIQYVSPSFGGLTFHGLVAINGSDDPLNPSDDNQYPYQLGAKYSAGIFSVAVAMDSNDNSSNSENTYGVHASADVADGLTVGALFSSRSAADNVVGTGEIGNEFGQTLYGVYGRYAIGANTFAASYEYEEADEDGGLNAEASVFTLQALHNVSDNLYVYAEGYLRNDDNADLADKDTTQLALGAAYLF